MAAYKPLQEQAYEYLKILIARGGLQPGVIYSETRMASEIGVSRTPMKDALVRLSQGKYIDIIPSKGFRLHEMSPQDIWATYQARTAVEGFCALNLSMAKDTPRGEKALVQMLSCMELMEQHVAASADISCIFSYDLQFHQILAHFPENEELSALFESLDHRVSFIAIDSFMQPGRPKEALREHWAIYHAIMASGAAPQIDPYLAVQHHMEASRDIALAHMKV